MARFVDLSIYLENDVPNDAPTSMPRVQYTNHSESVGNLLALFPGLQAEDLPGAVGWASERVSLTTHNGTHVDAPWHYHPTMDNGVPAATIDQLPLEWFFQPGVRLDFRHFEDGYVATVQDVQDALDRVGHVLKPLEIVLFNTRAGAAQGTPDFIHSGCGFSADATLFLVERGIRVVGTDAWGWDAPFKYMAETYARTGDPSTVWQGHKAGRFRGYCQIEKMTNLDQLPSSGFRVSCFPHKIRAASAGWTRAVAIFEN